MLSPNRIFLSNSRHPWSRGCSLNRGSNVFWSYLPIKLSRSKSSWPLSRLMSLSVILEFSAMPFKTSLSSSSPDKLRNSSCKRKRHVYCHNSKAIPPFFLLRYIYRAVLHTVVKTVTLEFVSHGACRVQCAFYAGDFIVTLKVDFHCHVRT